jgi:hypothetical protein
MDRRSVEVEAAAMAGRRDADRDRGLARRGLGVATRIPGRRRTRAVIAVALFAVLVALAGCGAEETNGSDAATTPAAPSSAIGTLTAEALLPAAQMPEWNGAMGWTEHVLPSGVTALTVCALPTAQSLGATQVLARDFEAAGIDDSEITPDPDWPASYATSVVAVFPDAAMATAAVTAWEDALRDCAPGSGVDGDVQSFQIGGLPTGSTWTAAASDAGEYCMECMRFEFVGFAAKDTAVALVGFSLSGQDANYEGDPLADSMEAALARLPAGGSRQ